MHKNDDLISRQAAIDAVKRLSLGETDAMRLAMRIGDYLERLPSAQPVITCDGCKFVGTYDTDFPCCNCIRREKDYYAQE